MGARTVTLGGWLLRGGDRQWHGGTGGVLTPQNLSTPCWEGGGSSEASPHPRGCVGGALGSISPFPSSRGTGAM